MVESMVLEVKAPANVKISGEHSVVYGGPSLAAAIEIFATAKVEDTGADTLQIELEDLGVSASLDSAKLKKLYKEYSGRSKDMTKKPMERSGLSKYIENNAELGKEVLPYATIAARLLVEQGISPIGKRITIHSDVPIQKGYASSSVCSTAFAMALIRSSEKFMDDQEVIDIIRDGERVVHHVETAGRMDVGPAYFGGYAIVSRERGIQSANIQTGINVIVIDTGPKPPTSEMVAKVRELYDKDTAGTESILKAMDACVLKCIEALKSGDIEGLGRHMSENHELLRKLGVSSERLDKAVSVALANGALGAKLCGGGGGGMGIALVRNAADAKKVIKALKENGFDANSISITFTGAKGSVRHGRPITKI